MSQASIQQFDYTKNVAAGVIIGSIVFVIMGEIVTEGQSESVSNYVALFVLLIPVLIGGFAGDFLQGVYKDRERSVWTDENNSKYHRWLDDVDTSDNRMLPSEWVIPISFVFIIILDIIIFEDDAGLIGIAFAAAVLGGITYLVNIGVLRLVTDPVNRRRIQQEGQSLFNEWKKEYEQAVSEAEEKAENGMLSDDTLEYARHCRKQCAQVKEQYAIKQTTYDVDERLESLEAELNRQQAKDRIDELTKKIERLSDRLHSAEDAGNYDRALDALDNLTDPLEKAEALRKEYDFDIGFNINTDDIEQIRRSLIEAKYDALLADATDLQKEADATITAGKYRQARNQVNEGIELVNTAKELADDWVFLSTQNCIDKRNSLILVQIKAIANQVAEIETEFQSQSGQKSAQDKLTTLESAINSLEQLHQLTTKEDIKRDVITTAGKVQTVLLAGRILTVEQEAGQARTQFQRGDNASGKSSFEDLVNKLDDIRDRTPDDALDEYGTELDSLQTACETNAERARKQDLGLESGLSLEPTDILGSKLRGTSQDQFEIASSGDTDVFNPADMQNTGGDTEIFDQDSTQSSDDTDVYDSTNPNS